MAIDELNPYQRNLKVVSGAFIAYWLLGLELKTDPSSGDGNMALMFIQFSIDNPKALMVISWALLFYSAWRYWVTKEDSFWQKVRESVRSNLGRDKQKSKRLDNQLWHLAVRHANSNQSWISELKEPYDGVKMSIAWGDGDSKQARTRLKCTFVKGAESTPQETGNVVPVNLTFRMLPTNYLKNIIRVLLKEDVTHTTVIPVLMFIAAIIAGLLTLKGIKVF
ncbi:hypothetical protein ACFOD1_03485 [Pseudidiomarina halophila]|uniref:Uncharacterized protein n=1 Tax=Pseudidiomarina halophila TaxID=1449799 RepID=A0A432XZ64_9GAMM|nr:hypothetical protein [Pseudidiomarina halophila]RUO54010.1 hypothetical protein CWI69_00835 [Pseudidiomarina halophila]